MSIQNEEKEIDHAKRKVEEQCMRAAITSLPQLKRYRIDTSRTAYGQQEERPDFILAARDGTRIGVEHFLVDTLFNKIEKKSHASYCSYSRRHAKTISDLFRKFGGEKVVGKEQEAIEEIMNDASMSLC